MITFIYWLVRLLCPENRSVAAFALVFEQDVVDVYEKRLIELDLTRCIEAYDLTRFSAAQARYLGLIYTMFLVTRGDGRSCCGASTTGLHLFDYVKSVFLGVELEAVCS